MTDITDSDISGQVLDWFGGAWDPDLSLVEWRNRLVDSGWAVPSWSSEWFGRDLPAWADRVAHTTIREAGGVAVPLGAGYGLAAPTMYDHASDELKRKYLRRTLTGELAWCQLFSEPGAGSDLAGLTTTAVRDGDEWIVNGQKVWNTSADHADMGILVARTDWGEVKHAGLSYFLLDMHQDGVDRSADRTDELSQLVQRGVPHRCPSAAREHGRGRRCRVEGRPGHPRPRAFVRNSAHRSISPRRNRSGRRRGDGRRPPSI